MEGERKTEEPLTLSPQALGTRAGVAALGPEQARVPRRDGAEGAGQAVPAVSTAPPPPPQTWPSCSRQPEPTVSRPRGLSRSRGKPSAPKGPCGLWAGGASQSRRGSVCPGGGVQPPPLGSPPEDSSLCRAVWQELEVCLGITGKEKDTQALGVSILINTPGTGLARRLWLPR